jgi:chorismate synthase
MNSFGRIFRISIFGESHGESIGVLIDGCPPGISISNEDFDIDLNRRKTGVFGTSTRKESDLPLIKSGILNGYSTGSPILIEFMNEDSKSETYSQNSNIPRPGHIDFVATKKYKGFSDLRGSGHFSGRLTISLVAAGVIAKKIISPILVNSKVLNIGGLDDYNELLENTIKSGDSLGGLLECSVDNMPIGLGEPFFDSIESLLSHIVFSIPGIKGIEFGSGFKSAELFGSENNDPIIDSNGKTSTNNSGGINGGISNGNNLNFRVAVKPTSSISKIQKTIDLETGLETELSVKGRHDNCFALRVPPILEAATAIVLADLLLLNKSFKEF